MNLYRQKSSSRKAARKRLKKLNLPEILPQDIVKAIDALASPGQKCFSVLRCAAGNCRAIKVCIDEVTEEGGN